MLRIQCPQIANTLTQTSYNYVGGAFTNPLIAANPLRKRLLITIMDSGGNMTKQQLAPYYTGFAAPVGIEMASALYFRPPDDSTEAKAAWLATGSWAAGAINTLYMMYEEAYQCASIILATSLVTKLVATHFGSFPEGYWTSGDLSKGAESFTLDATDGDAVVQEWYCWPVGSIAVAVNVMQSFDPPPIPPPLDDYSSFTIQMPSLPREGRKALDRLLARARLYKEPDYESKDENGGF